MIIVMLAATTLFADPRPRGVDQDDCAQPPAAPRPRTRRPKQADMICKSKPAGPASRPKPHRPKAEEKLEAQAEWTRPGRQANNPHSRFFGRRTAGDAARAPRRFVTCLYAVDKSVH